MSEVPGQRPPAHPTPPSPARSDLIRVIAIYAVFSAFWIGTSDALVDALVGSAGDIVIAGTLKGFAYIGIASALLYGMLRRWALPPEGLQGDTPAAVAARRSARRRTLLMVLATLAFSVIAVWNALGLTEAGRSRAFDQLRLMARLQGIGASHRVAELRHDAVEAGAVLKLSGAAEPPFPTTEESALRQRQIASILALEDLSAAQVFDATGKLVRTIGTPSSLPAELGPLVETARRTHEPALSLAHGVGDRVHIDVAAPLGGVGAPLEAIIVVTLELAGSDDAVFLPLFPAWPQSEAAIVQTGPGAPLVFSRAHAAGPSSARSTTFFDRLALTVVTSSRGSGSLVRALDAEGATWVASAEPVAGMPWHVVVAVPEDAVLSPIGHQVFWTLVASLLAVLLLVVALVLAGQRRTLALTRRRREEEHERLAILEELHRSREERAALTTHYETLTQQARDIFLLVGPDQRIVEANNAAEAAYGYSRDELRGLPIQALRDPRWSDAFPTHWNASASAGGILFETDHRRRDGTSFPVEVSVRTVTIDGRPYRQSFVRDISARREAKARLQESEERFRHLARATNDILWDWNVATGVVWRSDHASDDGEALTIEGGEDSGWEARIHPEDRARVVAHFRSAVDGTAERCSDAYRFARADGTYAHVVDRAVILRDDEGRAFRVFGGMSDQTADVTARAERDRQLDELRRWQAVTLGREGRVLELKREVNALLTASGEPPRYPEAERSGGSDG